MSARFNGRKEKHSKVLVWMKKASWWVFGVVSLKRMSAHVNEPQISAVTQIYFVLKFTQFKTQEPLNEVCDTNGRTSRMKWRLKIRRNWSLDWKG